MPAVMVIGGGLAGLASAAALGNAGYRVELFEARPFLGGRATSYALNPAEDSSETIDNCQHVLLRCCVNLLDFYKRLGMVDRIKFYREFFFIEPGGRTSIMSAGRFPAPFHFTESFWRLQYLNFGEKAAIGRALLAIRRERNRRNDLERITMLEWLREKRQPQRAIDRFWNQVLVSAINEDLDRMAALHGFQVFWLGFLARANSYQMGVPTVPLSDLYSSDAWKRIGNVRLNLRSPVDQLVVENGSIKGAHVQGTLQTADYYITSLPFERMPALIPELQLRLGEFTHSPITGIHLWFDRPITQLPHATLLDRTIQWMFNKSGGKYVQVVISASRGLTEMPKNEVIALVTRELADFFPAVREAKLEKSHVVKEIRATFSAKPGLEALRPPATTTIPNLIIAGDWTRSGWPATMEGAVRSGYLAAEAVTKADGKADRFVVPDIV
jgi:squalene-associated FAD-dependent desaturase